MTTGRGPSAGRLRAAGGISDKKKAPEGAFQNPIGLRRAGLDFRIDADLVARLVLVLELHDAIDQRVDREIGAEANVAARMPLGAALAHDDVPGDHLLAAELLDTTVLWI